MKWNTLTNTLVCYLLVGLLSFVPEAAAAKKAPRRLDPNTPTQQQHKTKSSGGKGKKEEATCPCASIWAGLAEASIDSCCNDVMTSGLELFQVFEGPVVATLIDKGNPGQGCGLSTPSSSGGAEFDSDAEFAACKAILSSVCDDQSVPVGTCSR